MGKIRNGNKRENKVQQISTSKGFIILNWDLLVIMVFRDKKIYVSFDSFPNTYHSKTTEVTGCRLSLSSSIELDCERALASIFSDSIFFSFLMTQFLDDTRNTISITEQIKIFTSCFFLNFKDILIIY